MRLSPAEYTVYVFKGVRATAKAVHRDPAAVSRWRKKGNVPINVQRVILEIAKEKKLDITPSDLINGRTIK